MQEVSRSYDQADENARQVVRRTRNVTRRKYTPEEKVRIVIEGIRGEISVSALCRREGINPGVYYKWLKDYMEAGKSRLKGDTLREANKAEVLQIVERSPLPVRQTLQELQIAPSTYYRWKSRYRDKGFNGLVDRPPEPRRVWNRLATKQRRYVVRYALEHPSLSPREVATTLVDEQVMYVSESTVYRILKEAGLIKPPETKGFPAGKEFHTKTARPNELWQTDASYFFVVGWGYYYLISVLDDYSRMIVGWRVQTSMSSADIIEVVQDAVEFTGQPTAPVEPGPALLSDNGPGFLSRALDEFLRARFMKHIFASPFHPQTNGKLERYHRTAKAKVNVFVHHSLEELVAAMEGFVRYYNYERYHEALGNITPADMYHGRQDAILATRQEVKQKSLAERRLANLRTA